MYNTSVELRCHTDIHGSYAEKVIAASTVNTAFSLYYHYHGAYVVSFILCLASVSHQLSTT